MNILVRGGYAVVGHHFGSSDNAYVASWVGQSRLIPDAHATLNRIDSVLLRVRDTDAGHAADDISVVAISGTAAASPTPPTIPTTGAYYVHICDVYVGAGVTSITNANITDKRKWTSLTNLHLRNSSDAAVDANTPDGLQGWELDTKRPMIYKNAAWHTLSTVTNVAVGSAPSNPQPGDRVVDPATRRTWMWDGAKWAPPPGTVVLAAMQSSAQSIATATYTDIQFNGTPVVAYWALTSTSTRFTPLVAGKYRVDGSVYFTANATGTRYCAVFKNGVSMRANGAPASASQVVGPEVNSYVVDMNGTTDYLTIRGYQTSGGALNTLAGVPFESTFTVTYVGPG